MRENATERTKTIRPLIFNTKGMNLSAVALDISNLVRLIFFHTENINSAEDGKCILKFFFTYKNNNCKVRKSILTMQFQT